MALWHPGSYIHVFISEFVRDVGLIVADKKIDKSLFGYFLSSTCAHACSTVGGYRIALFILIYIATCMHGLHDIIYSMVRALGVKLLIIIIGCHTYHFHETSRIYCRLG